MSRLARPKRASFIVMLWLAAAALGGERLARAAEARPDAGMTAAVVPSTGAPSADVFLAPRHIVLVNSDIENLWGSYFFAVQNKSSVAQSFKMRVMLPKETVDFRPQDGLTDADLKLGANGELWLEKSFAPGLSLVAVGFQTKVRRFGGDSLTFEPPLDLAEFSVGAPRTSKLSFDAPGFAAGVPTMLAGGQYEGIMSPQAIAAGSQVQVAVRGIPKERGNLWVLGFLTAAVMLGAGLALAYKTRPREAELGAEDSVW